MSALRVDHNKLKKQLQGAFVAQHGDFDAFKEMTESLDVDRVVDERSKEQKFAEDRKRLLADAGKL